jgi:hypothetical protein
MLVYANHLNLRGDGAAEAVFRAVGVWLKEQLGFGLHPNQLKKDGEFNGKRGEARSWLRVHATSEASPELYAWILKNADDTVRGRQWITELGLKSAGEEIEFSCVVRTEETSTLVSESVSASQPRIVRYVLNNVRKSDAAEFVAPVPGWALKTVGDDDDSYRGLLADIERRDRDYPIVLVSPTTDGGYLLNVDHLQETLFGLAQVVRATENFNSYTMEEILGQPWSAWNGAINVLHMPTHSGFVRGKFFLSGVIEDWGDTQHERIAQVLAWVTNNTNIPRLRSRVRPEGVAQLSMRRRLEAVRAKGAELGADQLREELETASRLEQEQAEWIDALEQDNARLEVELGEARAIAEEAERDLQKKEHVVQALKDQLSNAGGGRTTEFDLEALINLARRSDQPSPLECVDVVQSIYGDKCSVLESARKSASGMNRFAHGRQLLDMLIKLVTDYRSALMEGGDNQARKCFGKGEYAAKESETVSKSKDMLRPRTFEYNGNSVPMLRHLKIGVDDDETKTIRVHFHWDSEKQLIVIGYCGPHLPISSR